MKHFFSLCAAMLAATTLFAAERVVWEGNKAISWNSDVYPGEQFETPDGIFADLKKDEVIKVSVIAQIDEPQYVMTYKAGDSWEWTDLPTNVADGLMTYTVASDEIAGFIAQRGLIFRGQGYDMTKIAIVTEDEEPVDPDPLQPGEEKVLWEGEETLSWNEVAEQPAEVGALLAEKDQLLVTVSAKGTADWPKVLLRDLSSNQVGEDILLNEVSEFPYVATFTLSASDVEGLKDGFKLCGDGVTVTKLVLKKYKEPDDPVEPAEEYTFTTVWTGDIAISWNQEVYAGVEFDTYDAQQDMLAGVAEGDSIHIHFAEAIDGAQFALTYKKGDDWAWTDLTVVVSDDHFAYKIASEDIAQDIADHGLIIRGQGYHAVAIELGKPKTSAVDDVTTVTPARKIIENGQVLIIKDGVRYNILGAVVR
jgi:hypothetical protein